MADAAFDAGSGGDISYGVINTSGDQIADQSNSNEVEMAGRTPAVLMAREMFYRACEFSGNFDLNKEEAIDLYQQTLQLIGAVWTVEAGNTNVSIGEKIQSTNATELQSNSLQQSPQPVSTAVDVSKAASSDDDNYSDDSSSNY